MSEGQNRRVGQGMKPRGESAKNPHQHPATHKDHVEKHDDCAECQATAPTTEGQPESIIGPVLERQEGEQGGNHLETPEAKTAETAETPDVAPSHEFYTGIGPEYTKITDPDSLKTLEALAKYTNVDGPDVIGLTQGHTPDSTVQEVFGGPIIIKGPDYNEALVQQMTSRFAREIQSDLAVVREVERTAPRIHSLGEQENGSYKLVTTISEGYVEAVRQWAESDGVTMEEWVDRQLSGYLENWGTPARGR